MAWFYELNLALLNTTLLYMPIWTPEAINLLSTANANWTKNYSGVAIPSMHACRSYTVLTRLSSESDITTALMIDNGSFSYRLFATLADRQELVPVRMHAHGAQVGF